MLIWAILFLAIAIIAGILAFGGVAVAISFYAKILFLISLICLLLFIILIILEKLKNQKNKPKELI